MLRSTIDLPFYTIFSNLDHDWGYKVRESKNLMASFFSNTFLLIRMEL